MRTTRTHYRRLGALLVLGCCAHGLIACGGGARSAKPALTSSAGSKSAASSEVTFDPRQYYSRRALLVRTGRASYYADSFAGRRTANGEIYDPNAYTAAHRTLPFGSIVRVTNEKTGAWVLVRINDRGPFGARTRILDLSKQAAMRLAILQAGVARVRMEVLEMGTARHK
jgi:rare lipoprotein A